LFLFNDRARGIGAGWLLPFTFLSAAATAADAPPEAFSEAFSTVLIQGEKDSLQPSAPLADKGSPQSVVGEEAIHQIASPVGDYGTVLNLTPSFVSTASPGSRYRITKDSVKAAHSTPTAWVRRRSTVRMGVRQRPN